MFIPTKPPVVVVIIVPPVPTLSVPVVVIPETLNCVIEPMPPITDSAFRLVTTVVEDTVNGAVPVACVEVNLGDEITPPENV